MPKLQEALDTLKEYCLQHCLLQHSTSMRPTGIYEFAETAEASGAPRQMPLRRHAALTFYVTLVGSHRDVAFVIRHCLHCWSVKDNPLVTDHQRSCDYDGQIRYSVIDFVGPIAPVSGLGHRFMVTCVCAWSGRYWAYPSEDPTVKAATCCLFHFVTLDFAGCPVCIGSDAGTTFVSVVATDLIRPFDVNHIVGSAHHPRVQG